MQFDKEFGLPAVLGTKTSAAEYENHRMLTLQLRKLTAFGSMVSQFVVRKERAGDNVGSHIKTTPLAMSLSVDAACLCRSVPTICRDQECPLITFLFRIAGVRPTPVLVHPELGSARNEELAFPSTGVSSFFFAAHDS
jgi:hypothetical protein